VRTCSCVDWCLLLRIRRSYFSHLRCINFNLALRQDWRCSQEGQGGKSGGIEKEKRFLFSRRLFKLLDKDQDGAISASEVAQVLSLCPFHMCG